MKILYTVFSFKTGGIEKLIVDILNNIELKKDDKLYLCVINDIYDEELINCIDKKVTVKLLKRNKGSRNINYIIEYTRFLIREKIDIVHCQNLQCIKFSLLCKLLKPRVKLFHTVHSTKLYSNYSKSDLFIDKKFSYKIIAISQSVKNEIIGSGVKKEIQLVYNSIDISKFSAFDRSDNTNEIAIGNVARILPEHKGQDILIKAIKILKVKYPNIKCYFAGECSADKLYEIENLKRLAETEEVSNNIVFLGNVTNVPDFLSKIDLFVLPSRFEGFGIALVEAMAAKVPVIVSDVDGPREIVGENKYGLLFKNMDYKDLAEKISYALDNLNKFDTEKTSQYVFSQFNIKSMTAKLYNLYCS